MQTQLPSELLATERGRRADAILRSCVHCGMCNAVCPTYQLLGDELDGPRGRIYLIKGLLEGSAEAASPPHPELSTVRTHLDRCLTCRGCEVACPSGVQYGELLEIGREVVEEREVERAPIDEVIRRLLGWLAPRPDRFAPLVRLGTRFRWVLPNALSKFLPSRAALRLDDRVTGEGATVFSIRDEPQSPSANSPAAKAGNPTQEVLAISADDNVSRASAGGDTAGVGEVLAPLPDGSDPATPGLAQKPRRALLLRGCVQRLTTPAVNAAAARLLAANGVEALWAEDERCCGGLNLHLGQTEQAKIIMRQTLDALRPWLDRVDVIISTASGCGVTVKDYGRLLADDPDYAAIAAEVGAKTRDLAEVAASFTRLAPPDLADKPASPQKSRLKAALRIGRRGKAAQQRRRGQRLAWHAPCTLQHGQRLTGIVENLLKRAGFELLHVRNPHLCCGSAGIYSLLQRRLAGKLRDDKLNNLTAGDPDLIVTANVGCQTHLAGAASVPVLHWAELLAPPVTPDAATGNG